MYKLLDCNNREWDFYLNYISVDVQDIYYTREYYKMYQLNGDGIGKLFVYYDNNGNVALYPFMLKEIIGYNLGKKYYDIETAYGYGGPITNCNNTRFINDFEDNFLAYCNQNDIVAEFIRFHPLIKNESMFIKNVIIEHNRTTVWIDLTRDIGQIWNDDIKSKNRNMIRKAKKNGLYLEESNDFEQFRKIYISTMHKVNADSYYYFDNKYYDAIVDNNNYVLLTIKKEDIVIASAIFMKYKNFFHYHLAGSLEEYLKLAPNNLLLWEAINYAKKNGYKVMHLGGGLTNDAEDNLFKFKSSFSKKYSNFYIGKRIHNKRVYDFLISEWEKKHNKKAYLLLNYRIN